MTTTQHAAPNFDGLPEDCKTAQRWLPYLLSNRPGSDRHDKVPQNLSGNKVNGTDPQNWMSLEAVQGFWANGGCNGPGYALGRDDGVVAIDFDKVVKEGNVDPFIERVARASASYSENSQSGTGLHILVRGEWRSTRARVKDVIEVYAEKHFIALTGWRLPWAPARVNENQKFLDYLALAYFSEL